MYSTQSTRHLPANMEYLPSIQVGPAILAIKCVNEPCETVCCRANTCILSDGACLLSNAGQSVLRRTRFRLNLPAPHHNVDYTDMTHKTVVWAFDLCLPHFCRYLEWNIATLATFNCNLRKRVCWCVSRWLDRHHVPPALLFLAIAMVRPSLTGATADDSLLPSPPFSKSLRIWSGNVLEKPWIQHALVDIQRACWQSMTSPTYLESFLSKIPMGCSVPSAFFAWWTQGSRTMSRCWVVTAMCLGNFSWHSSPPTANSLLQRWGCSQMFFWQGLAAP